MKRFLVFLLCVMLMLCACDRSEDPIPTTTVPPTTTEPAPDAAAIYTEAANTLAASPNLTLRVTTKQTMTVAGIDYQDTTRQTIYFNGYGTDAMTAAMEEHTSYSTFWAKYDEVFVDGKVYIHSENSRKETTDFSGDMTAEEYTSRMVPPVLLDATLYASAAIDGKTITFSDATAPEGWLHLEDANLQQASAKVLLNDEGRIIRYDYELTYQHGAADFEVSTSVIVDSTTEVMPATAPTDEYTPLEYPDTARILDIAMGRISQNNTISASLSETILSQAAGFMQTYHMAIHSCDHDGQYMGDATIDVTQHTPQGSDSITYSHHYQNNSYSFTLGDNEPEESQGLVPADFRSAIEDMAGGWNLDLAACVASEPANLGGIYYLELEMTEDWALEQCAYLNSELWGKEDFLDAYASAYETTTRTGYIAIDGITGFPTAIGTEYVGTHTIEGSPCTLSLQNDYTFELASQSAYKAITDEPMPTEEPDQKATPLFYHVTGADGQEMWLFGTIHVGDSRTAYLPQKIYDAFDAADALAVEFNSDAFYDQMENDEKLQKLASEAHYYSDGTTTEDHIEDEEIYEYALKLMKATGNYNANTPYMKPSLWSNTIENTYLRLGYRLSGDFGMDNLLMDRAREQEKEILDVESGLEQLQMLGGYSDALQEYILASTLSGTAAAYQEGVLELFEMWCEGDEQALIAYLNEEDEEPDTSTMTEEELEQYNKELALMEEYNEAMSSSRNVEMVDVAIGYLESDKVVFYAVGLAHLLAEDGLVNALRDAGYTVELVTFP